MTSKYIWLNHYNLESSSLYVQMNVTRNSLNDVALVEVSLITVHASHPCTV